MSSTSSSWLHETLTLTRRYIRVGFALIPAGLVYAAWVRAKGQSQVVFVLIVVLDLICVAAFLRWTKRRIEDDSAYAISPALAAALIGAIAERGSTSCAQPEPGDILFDSLRAVREVRHQSVTIPEANRQAITTVMPGMLLDRTASRSRQPEIAQGADTAHAAFSGVSS